MLANTQAATVRNARLATAATSRQFPEHRHAATDILAPRCWRGKIPVQNIQHGCMGVEIGRQPVLVSVERGFYVRILVEEPGGREKCKQRVPFLQVSNQRSRNLIKPSV